MRKLSKEQRVSVLALLSEGMSVNGCVRLTGIAKTTILRLILDMGRICENFQDAKMRRLFCAEIEADEVWSFIHCKAKVVPRAKAKVESMGDSWTWYAVDRKSKAIISWIMGDRDSSHAYAFMEDLASRLIAKPDLTTDALGIYRDAVFDAFARLGCNYAQVHKQYETIETAPGRQEAVCIGCEKHAVFGSPKLERSGTSRVERANLTLRMSQRRWARKTNAHSKTFEHAQAAFAIHTAFYNWCRPHASLGGKTPAMVLSVADRVWTLGDLVDMLDADERSVIGTDENKRGKYKPRK